MLALREALAARQWQIKRWLGDAAECLDDQGSEHMVGLENLYRRARREERSTWPALIDDFLRRVQAAEVHSDPAVDLNQVSERIMIRLGPPMPRIGADINLWSKPLEGTPLAVNLVIDQPETMAYISEEAVAKSGKSGDEWLAVGISNLRQKTTPEMLQVIHADSGLRICGTGDAYDAARALVLDTSIPDMPDPGCLVVIPSRDELFILPLTPDALSYVHLLKVIAEKNYQSAPYSISNEVYWVRKGAWQILPIEVRGEQVTINPPQALVDCLQMRVENTEEGPPQAN